MAIQPMALGVNNPQINTVQALGQGIQAGQAIQGNKMELAKRGLGMIGSIALGAMGGDINGQVDPEKFNQGLDILASKGVDVEQFRNRPDIAPLVARSSLSTLQQIQNAQNEQQLELAMKKFDLEMAKALQPPTIKPTSDMQEYEFARSQGFEGTFTDFMQQIKKAGATTINMPGQPNIGSIPQGFQAIQDPETGSYRMERIPGGPEDQTANKQAQFAQEKQKAAVARSAIQEIRDKIDNGGLFDLPEVGVIGSRIAGFNQEAADVKNSLATLQSIVSFDRLQAMREASPTGGALGAVSERELALLQSSLGALSQDSSPEQLRKTLDFIDGVMAKFEAYPDQNTPSEQPQSGTGKTQSGITWSLE